MDLSGFKWTRKPKEFQIIGNGIEVTTKPYTDLF